MCAWGVVHVLDVIEQVFCTYCVIIPICCPSTTHTCRQFMHVTTGYHCLHSNICTCIVYPTLVYCGHQLCQWQKHQCIDIHVKSVTMAFPSCVLNYYVGALQLAILFTVVTMATAVACQLPQHFLVQVSITTQILEWQCILENFFNMQLPP